MAHFSHQQLLSIAGLPQLRYVTRDFRRADNLPARVADRRDGQRNVDAASILVLPDGLEVIDPLAAVNLLEDRGLFVETVGRDDNGDRPADNLFGRKAEKVLCFLVLAEDHAIEIF